MSGRRRTAIRLLAALAALGSARPAFADGALHYDTGRIIVVLGFLALAILGPIFLVVWALWRRALGRKPAAMPRQWVDAQPELPAARTVKDSRRAD